MPGLNSRPRLGMPCIACKLRPTVEPSSVWRRGELCMCMAAMRNREMALCIAERLHAVLMLELLRQSCQQCPLAFCRAQ